MSSLIERAKEALKGSTPGPWEAVAETDEFDEIIVQPQGRQLAVASVHEAYRGDREVAANAHFIALTPDLARAVIAAGELAEAVEHERNLACQDVDMQMDAAKAVDDALRSFRKATESPS